MAARRIVGRPGRRWRTSQRAQHAPGVRKRRRACPAAGKSPLVWAPGLLWWAAAPTGLWAHHDGSVSEGGRPADPSADRSIAFKRWPPGPLFGVDVKNNLSQLKGFAGNYPAKTSIPTGYTPQTGRGLEKRPPNPPLKMCNRCLATPTSTSVPSDLVIRYVFVSEYHPGTYVSCKPEYPATQVVAHWWSS